jgi:hypothetical protein
MGVPVFEAKRPNKPVTCCGGIITKLYELEILDLGETAAAQQKQIRELKVRLERRRWLLAQAHQIIHQGIPSHTPSARRVRDEINQELQ